jgi:molybdopterin-guanine dinucleotide biosynthesis protein A
MGRDKGLIDYHGQPQREHAAGLLAAFCEQVFISCRPDQAAQLNSRWPALSDVFLGLGPMGAILSAFQAQPDAAWLIVATDLPLLDQPTLWQLVQRREPSKMATAFHSPTEHFPEPLIAIWEPRAYPVLLQFLAQGYSCPRKALINSDVELVEAAHPQALFNVNNPEELADVMLRLGKSN